MKVLAVFKLLILSSIQFVNNASIQNTDQKKTIGLYSTDGDVEILTIHNFKQEIYGNKRAFLVEFYSSWCGFCRQFSASWKALGTDIKPWKDLVAVAAIDCANDENYPVCREFDILRYPTLKYFHENYEEGPKNLGAQLTVGSDVNDHRTHLIETVIKEQSEGRAKHFPILRPLNVPKDEKGEHDISVIFDQASPRVQYSFLIVHKPASVLGAEVTLDLHKIPEILVRYGHEEDYGDFLKKYNVVDLPGIFVIDRNLKIQNLSSNSPSRQDIQQTIKIFLRLHSISIPDDTKQEEIFTGKWIEANVPDMETFLQEKEQEALKQKVKLMGDVTYQMDLETTLRYMLKQETSRKKLVGESLDTLKKLLDLLIKYFPFGRNGKELLRSVRAYLDTSSEIKGSDISKMIKEAEKEERQVFSSRQEWLGCKGSSPEFRGYPCGLWELFHFLTVNAALDKNNQNDPNFVLKVMHGYVKDFFGCAECSNHFQEMAVRREIDKVASADDAVIWLWVAHNEVNQRLAGDGTEDPEYPKIQFPSKLRCPKCYKLDGTWNIPEVLEYLKHVYSSINVSHLGSDTKVLHLGLDGSASSSGLSSVFKNIDTNAWIYFIPCIVIPYLNILL